MGCGGPIEDIGMIGLGGSIWIGHVGDDREREDWELATSGDEDFGDGAHADHIGTHSSEGSIFGSGFVVGSKGSQVGASGEAESESDGGALGSLDPTSIVHVGGSNGSGGYDGDWG